MWQTSPGITGAGEELHSCIGRHTSTMMWQSRVNPHWDAPQRHSLVHRQVDAPYAKNPKFGVAKFRKFGKIVFKSALGTPNHAPMVAANWSTDVVGIK
jgi:hypothetical protein